MGSLGMGVKTDENDNETYVPYIFYNENKKTDNSSLTSLSLIPEPGLGIKIEGHKISHPNEVTAVQSPTLMKMKYNNSGHITGNEAVNSDDIRTIGRIAYGSDEPSEGFNPFGSEELQGGEIYFWVQGE